MFFTNISLHKTDIIPKLRSTYKIIILIEKQTNINKEKTPAFLPYTSSRDCLEQFPVRM